MSDPTRKTTGPMAAALTVAVLLGLGAGLCRAQAPAPEPAPTPLPADGGILLNFREAPLAAVLEHLSDQAGLVIVEEAVVQGRVTVMSRQPLSTAEAVSLLNTVLADQGYAAVRTGRTLKIVTLQDAKQMNVPVRAGADPALIEPNDEVVTQVIPLKFADAVQVREDLASLIPSYAEMSANASSNSLILTDTGANVRRIVEIVRALDTHLATVAEVRVFPLRYADATDAADLINRVFEQQAAEDEGRGRRFWPGRFFRGRGDEEGEEAASRAPHVIAAADERTNTVVVSGATDTLEVVAQVVEQLDANPVAEESVLVVRLNNASAANVAELLNDLFSQADEDSGALRTGREGRGEDRGPGAFFRMMQQQAAAAAVEGEGLAGNVYVVADEDTNALLILTPPSNFETLRAIITELDRAIPQVLIKVLVAEVTWSDDTDIGVEFSILDTEPDGDEFSLSTDFGLDAETGGLIYKHVVGDVTALLRALEEVGKLDILSRPHILTSDNQTATITVGQEVPFIRNTRTTETGQTINTIEYEDIGIILEVTPHINPEGLVIMDVSPEISSTTADTVPISETVDAAVFAKRSATTRIAIRDSQTIVIGGLMEDKKTESITKVPLLGDVPLLGALFRRTEVDKEKTELLIFLTPHVAPEADRLQAMSEEEMTGVRQMKEAIAPGVFDEHMRGMKLGAGPGDDLPPED
jgi:general secretion pathway protein D